VSDGAWLVVGLGNPGREYAGNRHNIGFQVVDLLADRLRASFKKARTGRADVVEGRLPGAPTGLLPGPSAQPGSRVVLAKPRSYMNESGAAVAGLRDFYRTDPAHLVVVHDELDIPFGTLRLKLGGGDNGHNGLKSIRRSLGTGDFHRVRFGIGRPPGRMDPASFVLRDFSTAEREELGFLVDRAADAVESLVQHGLGPTQNDFHA
jgi:peptidyl-tRNA hydrolase, PTH1 family